MLLILTNIDFGGGGSWEVDIKKSFSQISFFFNRKKLHIIKSSGKPAHLSLLCDSRNDFSGGNKVVLVDLTPFISSTSHPVSRCFPWQYIDGEVQQCELLIIIFITFFLLSSWLLCNSIMFRDVIVIVESPSCDFYRIIIIIINVIGEVSGMSPI